MEQQPTEHSPGLDAACVTSHSQGSLPPSSRYLPTLFTSLSKLSHQANKHALVTLCITLSSLSPSILLESFLAQPTSTTPLQESLLQDNFPYIWSNFTPIVLHYYWCGVNKTQPDEWFGEWLSHLHSLIMLQTRGHLGVGGMLCCIWEAYTTLKATLPVNPMTLPHSECHTCSISQGNEFTQTRGSGTKKDELRSKGGVKRIFLLWHLLTDRCSSWEGFWSTAIFQVPT